MDYSDFILLEHKKLLSGIPIKFQNMESNQLS